MAGQWRGAASAKHVEMEDLYCARAEIGEVKFVKETGFLTRIERLRCWAHGDVNRKGRMGLAHSMNREEQSRCLTALVLPR